MHPVAAFVLTCLCLACAEVLNGIARIRVLIPALGKARAQALSVCTGLLWAGLVCAYFLPLWAPTSGMGLFAAGGALALFMAAFDVLVGRLLMHRPWPKIARDFDPRSGNYLSAGLLALVFLPWALVALRVV